VLNIVCHRLFLAVTSFQSSQPCTLSVEPTHLPILYVLGVLSSGSRVTGAGTTPFFLHIVLSLRLCEPLHLPAVQMHVKLPHYIWNIIQLTMIQMI